MAKEESMEQEVEEPSSSVKDHEQSKINYIGDRSAIIFSAASGEPLPPVDLPDEFFELEKSEIQQLFKELKQQKDDLENMPFRTKAQREMEENAAMLNQLKRYSQTVIRVQFPDRLVIQAVFNHSDTVQTVMDFVMPFLDSSDVQFHLYTAPPKNVLKPDMTLIDARLTPRALVYFSVQPPQDRTSFLKPSLAESLTSITLASEAAFQYMKELPEEDQKKEPIIVQNDKSSSSPILSSLPSTSKKGGVSSNKIPKWFKN